MNKQCFQKTLNLKREELIIIIFCLKFVCIVFKCSRMKIRVAPINVSYFKNKWWTLINIYTYIIFKD